jgi:hypothetical protein
VNECFFLIFPCALVWLFIFLAPHGHLISIQFIYSHHLLCYCISISIYCREISRKSRCRGPVNNVEIVCCECQRNFWASERYTLCIGEKCETWILILSYKNKIDSICILFQYMHLLRMMPVFLNAKSDWFPNTWYWVNWWDHDMGIFDE